MGAHRAEDSRRQSTDVEDKSIILVQVSKEKTYRDHKKIGHEEALL